jgi:hypothetical protein
MSDAETTALVERSRARHSRVMTTKSRKLIELGLEQGQTWLLSRNAKRSGIGRRMRSRHNEAISVLSQMPATIGIAQ